MKKSAGSVVVIGLLLLLVGMVSPVQAQSDNAVKVINESGEAVFRVYVSPVGNTGWGRDRLGDQVLRDGYNITFRISPNRGCYYDLRAEMENGAHTEHRSVNLCSGNDWTIFSR